MLDLDQRTTSREALWAAGVCWLCREEDRPDCHVTDSPLCKPCSATRLDSQREENSNPYRNAWDNPEDLELPESDTLFSPDYGIMAFRHAQSARFLLSRARNIGRGATGRSVFERALAQVRLAKRFQSIANRIDRSLR